MLQKTERFFDIDRKKPFWFAVIVILLFIIFLLISVFSPVNFKGEKVELMLDRPEVIWKSLTDVEKIPKRKQDVASIDIISYDRQIEGWRENLRDGGFRMYRVVERFPHSNLKLELISSSNGVSGTWEYELEKRGSRTKLKIKEESMTPDLWLRGWYTILGRNILIRRELKSLRVSLFQKLLTTE